MTWHPIPQLPDSDTTVLVACAQGAEPVWLGYHDGETWRDISGEQIGPVTHWADLPEPPTHDQAQDPIDVLLRRCCSCEIILGAKCAHTGRPVPLTQLTHCRITNHHNTTDGYCPTCLETFKRQAQTSAANPAATQIAA